MADTELTASDELFLLHLETSTNITAAAEAAGMSQAKGYLAVKRLKDTIVNRARDNLAGSLLKAVNTTAELLSADSETEKGELRLKAAEGILDRTGITKHTNVDVQIENEHGLFMIPLKQEVPPEPSSDET